ncbi:MAG: hypothetical protein ACRECH_10525 [Nitrososphaerales archaeon]
MDFNGENRENLGLKILASRHRAERLSTASTAFDSILGGGIATCAVTDIYGAAGTGKTQFAFQCSLLVSQLWTKEEKIGPALRVAFVDCAGSFRPERIAQMADARGMSNETHSILESISAINVRSVSEQTEASERILSREEFSKCKLIVVDDVTRNFVSEYGTESALISRQHELAIYARNLAYLALSKKAAVLLTNSVRSTMDGNEKETTGSAISQFSLFRIHFRRYAGRRHAEVLQPLNTNRKCDFEIETSGIVP